MEELKWYKRLMIWLLKKLGGVVAIEISKAEMCERAKAFCDGHCEGCAWKEDKND